MGTAAGLLWPGPDAEANRHDPMTGDRQAFSRALTESLALPERATATVEEPTRESPQQAQPEITAEWQEVTVKSGDSLAAIFSRLDLSPRALHRVVNAGAEAKSLTRIHPGQVLRFDIRDGELHGLEHRLSPTQSMLLLRTDDGFDVSHEMKTVETRLTHSAGVIDSSLYAAGKNAGLSDRLIMEMVGIFSWDVDFALDIRGGDSFLVLYEERFLDGEKLGEGNIVAAEFVSRGEVFRAVRFADADGRSNYYAPDGRSMRKAFLRSPVDFRRISSRFSGERHHPVLGKKRPHRGVDYAAGTGTPIKASGDGKIIHRGWKGGYGRTIIIQHGGSISTLYGHMSRYGGLRVGSRVKQGQTIGYVGASGLATGPHLHYEFRLNGVHRNPLTVKLPKAEPIADQYRAEFQAKASTILAQLDVLKRTQVAAAE
ncbi:Opacity-associated protein A LysM-like domain-containing protein [Thiohalomonas denitrificans]|uniref:Opacity-associated protein A LysM-like domain-containing protein n=2 Tax=Thiohalomonas denitrificans TaxID=415747 RepID=A0A1G5PQC6_9GAMM|nr:Opacity-associated protein A LysM-like domain-containing protein [Thiohalomonas denitrificans]